MTVTFLIPAFAMLWGGLILGEAVTGAMLAGCAVILAGTALATGVVRVRSRAPTSRACTSRSGGRPGRARPYLQSPDDRIPPHHDRSR